jgi:P2X purinoceptor 4
MTPCVNLCPLSIYELSLTLYRFTFLVWFYSYVIIYRKGYQDTDSIVSSVTTKMKGTAMTNYSARRLWDVAEYVIPPQVKEIC